MRKALLLLVAPVYMLLVANFSCNTASSDQTQPVEAYFWKNSDTTTIHNLYIDDSIKGILPYLPDSLTQGESDMVKEQGVLLRLIPGKYKVVAKDRNNNILCEGTLSIKIKTGNNHIKNSWNNNKCHVRVVLDN